VNIELLRVEAWVRLDQDGLPRDLFHLLQPLGGRLQLLDHVRVDSQHDVAAVEVAGHLAHLDVDVVADRYRRLHHAGSCADVAGRRQRAFERLLDALASDGDQAKVVELKNLRRSAIVLQLLFERGHHTVAVLALVHVDEVDDDDAAKVAQANLTNDLGDGIEVGLDDGVLEPCRLADVLARVDVDGDESLGLVDDDRAAGLQPTLERKALLISSLMPNCSKSGVSLV
jgi:rhodanese-related sulfurtransferase